MDLSIIIVNFRTYDHTKKTIESVINQDHPFLYKIYVVDNASQDGSLEKLKERFRKDAQNGLIEFISQEKNRGFATANNSALRKIKSKYVLLLNSDTQIIDDCLERCLNYLEDHTDVGALGCKVLLEDGSLDKACRRSFPSPLISFYRMLGLSLLFPKNKHFNRYNLGFLNPDDTYPIDALTGAFMMLRSQVIKKAGYMDEKFFMYGEDIDWCYRIKNKGWKIVYHGAAEIIHYKGASSSQKQNNKQLYEFYRAMYIFYKKHYKSKYPRMVTLLVYVGIGGQYLLKRFINNLKILIHKPKI